MTPWWRTLTRWGERQRFRRAAQGAAAAWDQEVPPWIDPRTPRAVLPSLDRRV